MGQFITFFPFFSSLVFFFFIGGSGKREHVNHIHLFINQCCVILGEKKNHSVFCFWGCFFFVFF